MFRKIVFLVIAAMILASVLPASAAGPLPGNNHAKTEVLISMSGGTDALAAYLQKNGGVVRTKYQNVPALAAAVPVVKLGEIASFPGVLSITRNVQVRLEPDPLERFGVETRIPLAATEQVKAIAPQTIKPSSIPAGFVNSTFTRADQVWQETNHGSGSIIAVIDTGVTPIPCLEQAVIGAPGFPDGFNATGDGISPTDPQNYDHGTFVSFVAAASCALSFTDESDPLWQAIHAYQPQYTMDYVPLLGQAPDAKIYPVKVFSPVVDTYTWEVLLGLDHVITLKKSGALDIDIINMSLAFPAFRDGKDLLDEFVEAAQAANILVVVAAGNFGPTPNTVGNPASSYAALSVGALDYAASSRIFYEYLGLISGLGAGTGMAMRPTSETRLAAFSARGPLSDGRLAPEITALGWLNFGCNQNYCDWGSGTSFASPTVAGGAALLNAWWESQGRDTDPVALENALLKGANPNEVGPEWRRPEDQGYGVLDIPAALAVLKSGDLKLNEKKLSQLKLNVLGKPVKGKTETWSSGLVSINPSQFSDYIFEISPDTSRVKIEVSGIDVPDNSATTFWSNSLWFNLGSATRSGVYPPIGWWNWRPYWEGDSFTIIVEDGQWIVDSQAYGPLLVANQPMQTGLMKLSLGGDMVNDSPVSFNVRITRENYAAPRTNRVGNGVVKRG